MPDLEIRPFSDGHLDDAARLLAARHERHRQAEPLLPEVTDFRAEIEREWREDGASGVAALSGDQLVGYLVASPRRFGSATDTWMVVGIAGHAVARNAELVRDLYAAAASAWVDAGHTRHGAFVPTADASLLDAWFRLSFGASGALAMRETAAAQPFDADVRVRHGTPADLEDAARLDRLMTESMIPSPSFLDRTLTDGGGGGVARHVGRRKVRALRGRARRADRGTHRPLPATARPACSRPLDRPRSGLHRARGAGLGRRPRFDGARTRLGA
jgi:hypothetical protein